MSEIQIDLLMIWTDRMRADHMSCADWPGGNSISGYRWEDSIKPKTSGHDVWS